MALGASGPLQVALTRYRRLQMQREVSLARAVTTRYSQAAQLVQRRTQQLLSAGADALANRDSAWLTRSGELQAFRQDVYPWLDGLARTTATATTETQRASILAGANDSLAILRIVTTRTPLDGHSLEGLTSPAMSALADRLDRAPLRKLFSGWSDAAYADLRQTLLKGFSLGVSPREVASAVTDAFGMDYGRALTVSRTEGLRGYRDATLASYQAQGDLVDGWVWVADLSVATCMACIALNGSVHELSEQLDDHVNGRCAMAPHLAPVGGVQLGPTFPSGESWLGEQSAEDQQRILGPTRYALYANESIALSDIVTTRTSSAWGDSIGVASLAEMGVSQESIAQAVAALAEA